jgi:hypothetical protein
MTSLVDPVADALERAADPAGSWLWRSVSGLLQGTLRIAVVGRDEGLVHRVARHLPEGAVWLPIVVGSEPGAALAVQDRLLEAHAMVFATPLTAPLGALEREWLIALGELGGPAERAVVVGDKELLARMSDAPEQEAREVAARVAALTPPDWRVVDEGELHAEVTDWRARFPTLAARRRAAVGRVLLADALRRAEGSLAAATAEHDRVAALLRAEDDAVDEAARAGQRTATHLLSAARRQTERLRVDCAAFLAGLEAELPAQIDAVPDLDLVRRALPHWLHHVVEGWMTDRVARYRAELEVEIAELGIPAADLERAELVAPAVYARIPHSSAGWGKRLGVTAAMGGGAALMAFGLWIPGLIAVSGGALFSALGRRAEQAQTRRALVDGAVDAVRKMAADADRLLRDQLAGFQASLGALADERRRDAEAVRADVRRRLGEERAHRAVGVSDRQAVRDGLAAALQGLAGPT